MPDLDIKKESPDEIGCDAKDDRQLKAKSETEKKYKEMFGYLDVEGVADTAASLSDLDINKEGPNEIGCDTRNKKDCKAKEETGGIYKESQEEFGYSDVEGVTGPGSAPL